nr:MAG TPA: hypothetical protein [Bacteriophage sp.]
MIYILPISTRWAIISQLSKTTKQSNRRNIPCLK